METARLETFSDGVFAIAATLLILDVRLPPRRQVAHGFLSIWPSYAAYALAFVTIGIMWINHHTVFGCIDRVDRTFLIINVFFLMLIAFIPFPTRVLAEHLQHDAKAAAFVYGLTMVLMAVLYNAALVLRGQRPAPDRRRRRPANGQRHLPRVHARRPDLRSWRRSAP